MALILASFGEQADEQAAPRRAAPAGKRVPSNRRGRGGAAGRMLANGWKPHFLLARLISMSQVAVLHRRCTQVPCGSESAGSYADRPSSLMRGAAGREGNQPSEGPSCDRATGP